MTVDERLNDLEDQVRKLKEAINHNNAVARKLNESLKLSIATLQSSVDKLRTEKMASPFDFADFGSGRKP